MEIMESYHLNCPFVVLFIYLTDLHPLESQGWHQLGVGCWPVVPLVPAQLAGLRGHCCCWYPVNIYRQCTVRVCVMCLTSNVCWCYENIPAFPSSVLLRG